MKHCCFSLRRRNRSKDEGQLSFYSPIGEENKFLGLRFSTNEYCYVLTKIILFVVYLTFCHYSEYPSFTFVFFKEQVGP